MTQVGVSLLKHSALEELLILPGLQTPGMLDTG